MQLLSSWPVYLLAGPPTIEPDYDKMTKKSLRDKDVKVAVVCFAPDEVRLNFIDVDKDIAKYCAHQLNQHHIPVINPDRIQEWLDKHEDWDKPEEIGEATKATHVILVDVHKYNLFEENTPRAVQGPRGIADQRLRDAKGRHARKRSTPRKLPASIRSKRLARPLRSATTAFVANTSAV